MKKLQTINSGKYQSKSLFNLKKRVSLITIFLVLAGLYASAQLPVVTVRMNNPQFNCETQEYCVDVEFQSNVPNEQLFGINVRFFYDAAVLQFDSLANFVPGYGPYQPDPPTVTTYNPGSGVVFGFPANSQAEFVNGAVQIKDPTNLVISTTEWTRIFSMCFSILDPNGIDAQSFCPPIVWDLEEDPANGGFITGSNGVVISLVLQYPDVSKPATENVIQYNWAYDGVTGPPFGFPEETVCIPTICALTDFGDAPEGALAYPDLGVMGSFPTCLDPTLAGHILHYLSEDGPVAYFGPTADPETNGNAGLCSPYGPYNNDECFDDQDAGLLFPASPYTIGAGNNYMACSGTANNLGAVGDTIEWGNNVDIVVSNFSGEEVFVNVLIDWNQNGMWDNDPTTMFEGMYIPEHCLVNFPVPDGYTGPLSVLNPPDFYAGPHVGFAWARFSITEDPVEQNWDGSGEFALGETEDYLFRVGPQIPLSNWALFIGIFLIAGLTILRLRKS